MFPEIIVSDKVPLGTAYLVKSVIDPLTFKPTFELLGKIIDIKVDDGHEDKEIKLFS